MKNITLEDFREFLINYDKHKEYKEMASKKTTDYKRLLCIYDICKYSGFEYNGEQVIYNVSVKSNGALNLSQIFEIITLKDFRVFRVI